MTDTERQIADRRRQWQHMTPECRMQAVQAAILGTLDHARQRRRERLHSERQQAQKFASRRGNDRLWQS